MNAILCDFECGLKRSIHIHKHSLAAKAQKFWRNRHIQQGNYILLNPEQFIEEELSETTRQISIHL
jgi:hypothetical protein